MLYRVRLPVVVIVYSLLSPLCTRAQDSVVHYLYEPLPLTAGQSVFNLGMSLSLVPAPIVEQELVAPTVDFQFKYGLTSYFTFYGGISTNYFATLVGGGLQFNNGDHEFSYSGGCAIIGFAGVMDMGGEFSKNTAGAFALLPTFRFSRRFGDVALTMLVSASYILYADTHVGSLENKNIQANFNDLAFEFAIEQPFFGKTYVSLGIGFTYSRTPYQIWMLYNSFDQYLVVPATFFSFRL